MRTPSHGVSNTLCIPLHSDDLYWTKVQVKKDELKWDYKVPSFNWETGNLVTLATFLFIVDNKFHVIEARRESMFQNKPGYGVMPKWHKWEPRIKGVVSWLMNATQCPTKNVFILSERKRLKNHCW